MNYIERMKEERKELIEKKVKLDSFLLSFDSSSLGRLERDLLKTQSGIMSVYIDVLEIRIYMASPND